jgi:hypothetical protein
LSFFVFFFLSLLPILTSLLMLDLLVGIVTIRPDVAILLP